MKRSIRCGQAATASYDAGITVDDVHVHQPSLDDVFFALTGHAAEDAVAA